MAKLSNPALDCDSTIVSLVLNMQRVGVKIIDTHVDYKSNMACIVFNNETTSKHVIGRVKKIVDKFNEPSVNISKDESTGNWYIIFNTDNTIVLSEYFSIMQEIVR